MLLPRPEGISGERRVYGDEAAGPPFRRLKEGASLADLRQDYALFTYAPLFLYGGLEHNPVQEWINAHGHGQIVFIFPVPSPIFRMRADPIWDHTLWAVEKEHWPSLSLHVGSVALIDRGKQTVTRVICQEIPVFDVAAKQRLGPPGKITVTTFSPDSNLACAHFVPAGLLQGGRPALQVYPPRKETVKFANALLSFSTNPYQGIQKPPWEQTADESYRTPAPPVRGRDRADDQD
jgi:hypothetical protein